MSKPQGNNDNNNKDATSKNDGDHNVVFFAMVAVGAHDVIGGGDSSGD